MMTLVDTSIWIDHFRHGDLRLAKLLDRAEVVTHPFVVGELLLGRALGTDELIGDLEYASEGSRSQCRRGPQIHLRSKVAGIWHRICRCASAGCCRTDG
jgi:predicted nucleic acid-binding protein